MVIFATDIGVTGIKGVDVTNLSLMCYSHWEFVFPVALRLKAGHALPILEVSRSHTTTHHSR